MTNPISGGESVSTIRPSALTFIAMIAIILGFVSIASTPVTFYQILKDTSPYYTAVRNDNFLYYYMLSINTFGCILIIYEIILGFGLLKLNESARSGAILYCIVTVIFGVLCEVVNLTILTPKRLAINIAIKGPGRSAASVENVETIATIIGISVMILFTLAHIFIAIYLNRPSIKELFLKDKNIRSTN